MTNESRGLSFQEAVQESLAEEAAETVEPEGSFSDDPSNESDVLEVEQPTVESDEESGFFADLVDEEEIEVEQPVDTDSLTIEIEGQQMTIAQIRELVAELHAGNMMKADYTRKTQELASQRDKLSKAETLWDALHGPDGARIATRLYNSITAGQSPSNIVPPQPAQNQTPDIDALIEQKVQEKLAEMYTQDNAINRINAVFTEIENEHDVVLDDDARQKVLIQAQKYGVDNEDGIKLVFRDMLNRKNSRAANLANIEKNATATSGRIDEILEEEEPTEFGSFREAMNDTLRREAIVETSFAI